MNRKELIQLAVGYMSADEKLDMLDKIVDSASDDGNFDYYDLTDALPEPARS
jgi:hypothetical protein